MAGLEEFVEVAVSCVFCDKDLQSAAPSSSSCESGGGGEVRVMPCLHAACAGCISERSGDTTAFPAGIFPCPSCEFKVLHQTVGSPSQFKTMPRFFARELSANGTTSCCEQKVKNTAKEADLKELDISSEQILGSSREKEEMDEVTREDTVAADNTTMASELNNGYQGNREDGMDIETKDVVPQKTGTADTCEEDTADMMPISGLPCGDSTQGSMAELLEGENNQDLEFYCTTCDQAVRTGSIDKDHLQHDLLKLPHMLKSKREYIQNLLKQVLYKMDRSEDVIRQIPVVKDHLSKTRDELAREIENRSKHLIQMIERRKEVLLNELHKVCVAQDKDFDQEAENQQKKIKMCKDSYNFAEKVINRGTDQDLLTFHNDITNRLLQLIHHMKDASLEILSLKVDIPERGKEESHLEKLFGSLMQGNISCGDAELLLSFNIDLKWPTSLVSTKSRDIVIAGKAGTFDSQGKLLFYDKQGKLHSGHQFEDKCIPNDVACAADGTILVSDNKGRISKFTPQGKVYEVMEGKFKGSNGRLALTTDNHILVTSADDNCVMKYDFSGREIAQLQEPANVATSSLSQPHCLATNLNNDIILSVLNSHDVSVFDSEGSFKFQYSGGDSEGNSLKCPSAICCDPFNNILVADFTSDMIHLVSSNGEFLGNLLTKDNGISCPNFISLDHEGHLFVGQYGGDVAVFRYLSCVKHA